MIYSTSQKSRMDNILAAFQGYIQTHPSFDIVYSEKIGYIRLNVEDPDAEDLTIIESADDLLEILFDEIINDVRFGNKQKRRRSSNLSESDKIEIRRQITDILKTVTIESEHCLEFMDSYLEDYFNEE